MIPTWAVPILQGVANRLTEPSTYAGSGGALAVLIWASENKDFLVYLKQNPLIAVVLILFGLGAVISEKKQR